MAVTGSGIDECTGGAESIEPLIAKSPTSVSVSVEDTLSGVAAVIIFVAVADVTGDGERIATAPVVKGHDDLEGLTTKTSLETDSQTKLSLIGEHNRHSALTHFVQWRIAQRNTAHR